MRKLTVPTPPKWPFVAGDAILVLVAAIVYTQGSRGMAETLACLFCVALGAVLAILPFYLEYQTAAKLVEAEGLNAAISQIKNLEQLSAQIGYVTSQWQIVRESADKTANVAKELAQGMSSELKAFHDFMQRSNEGEKATLRLEADKMRRAEVEFLQVIVRMLDHTYALHQAALRARQPGVAEQIGNFQNACRDVARRIGLMPLTAAPEEPFDEQKHQLANGDAKPPAGAEVEATVATGYSYQGKMLRPVLVTIRGGQDAGAKPAQVESAQPNPAPAEPASGSNAGQSQLPLESAK